MDVVALPVGPGYLPAWDVAEVLAVVHVGPQAHRAVGPGALASADVFTWEHLSYGCYTIFFVLFGWF